MKVSLSTPWRVRIILATAAGTWRYLGNRMAWLLALRRRRAAPRILFCIPFYGYTGGSFAVLSAANLLSRDLDVAYLTTPSNIMNKYVSTQVRMVSDAAGLFDFCVVESGVDMALVRNLKERGARVILTMHGAPNTPDGARNHGYSDSQVTEMMTLVDSVQYVSDVQLPFFDQFPRAHRRKIPNAVSRIEKHEQGRSVGVVCDTTLPHKRADAAIRAAELSDAATVEIWGNHHGNRSAGRVRWNGFSGDKQRIYGSFDVLVHLSRLENQPLVILEAMSAGIPCVLAPLSAYDFLRGLDGIHFVDADDPAQVSHAINRALDSPRATRDGLVKFWSDHHSPEAGRRQWLAYLADLGGSGVEQPVNTQIGS